MPRWSKAEAQAGESTLAFAQRLQDQAAALGFDWTTLPPVLDKLSEESAELREAIADGHPAHISHELGDVLFTLVNLARFLKLDTEQALQQAASRFDQRLSQMQRDMDATGEQWTSLSLEELEQRWQQAKLRLSEEPGG
jgi:uncharacterized protein YabN with tetrapyrrole methylase and pyrophosphatase domain